MSSAKPDRLLIDALLTGPLVVDGAMGTQLYERGVLYSACFEELNVSRAELVLKVHDDYVRAGAQVIETNTFGANALRLEKYGLQGRVRELNLAGVRLAREAGESGGGDLAKVKVAIAEQAAALVKAGVDALVVETMRQAPELRVTVEA